MNFGIGRPHFYHWLYGIAVPKFKWESFEFNTTYGCVPSQTNRYLFTYKIKLNPHVILCILTSVDDLNVHITQDRHIPKHIKNTNEKLDLQTMMMTVSLRLMTSQVKDIVNHTHK